MKTSFIAVLSLALVACTPAASPVNDAGDAQADAADAAAPAPAAKMAVAAPVDAAAPKAPMVPDASTKK